MGSSLGSKYGFLLTMMAVVAMLGTPSKATPLLKAADFVNVPNFQDKKKWVHLGDEVHMLWDENGNAVPVGVTRFYRQTGGSRVKGSEFIFLGMGRGITVYKQWGTSRRPLQAILRHWGEGASWTTVSGSLWEYTVRVSQGRVRNFLAIIYQGNNDEKAFAFLSFADPEEEKTPASPSSSSMRQRL